MSGPVTRNEVLYWPTEQAARDFALSVGLPDAEVHQKPIGWVAVSYRVVPGVRVIGDAFAAFEDFR